MSKMDHQNPDKRRRRNWLKLSVIGFGLLFLGLFILAICLGVYECFLRPVPVPSGEMPELRDLAILPSSTILPSEDREATTEVGAMPDPEEPSQTVDDSIPSTDTQTDEPVDISLIIDRSKLPRIL